MIVTEKEAAEKWCPMSRVAKIGTTGITPNRYESDGPRAVLMVGAQCIGSRCMMWAWVDLEDDPVRIPEFRRGTCGLINTRIGHP